MKKLLIIGLLLLLQYTCSASEDHHKDAFDLNNYKMHRCEKTGETIFYSKKYESYEEFKVEHITNLLKERLKIFFDMKNIYNKLKGYRHLLDINTTVLSNNLDRELRGKIFGETYDDQQIKTDHLSKVASVLKDRLSDETEKENLNSLIQHFDNWNNQKEKTLVLEGLLFKEVEKVEETDLTSTIPMTKTESLQRSEDTSSHTIEKDDKVESTLEDQKLQVNEVFKELARLVELESIYADDIDCTCIFPATEKEFLQNSQDALDHSTFI